MPGHGGLRLSLREGALKKAAQKALLNPDAGLAGKELLRAIPSVGDGKVEALPAQAEALQRHLQRLGILFGDGGGQQRLPVGLRVQFQTENGLFQVGAQVGRVHRLEAIADHAALERLLGVSEVGVSADQNALRIRGESHQLPKKLQPASARHFNIRHHDMKGPLSRQLQRTGHAVRFSRHLQVHGGPGDALFQ